MEAERALIGAILMDGALFDSVSIKLTYKMFRDELASMAFKAMGELFASGKSIDFVSVISIVGDGFKADLYEYTKCANPRHIDAYIGIIFDGWRERTLCAEIMHLSVSGSTADDITAQLELIVERQRAIVDTERKNSEKSFYDAVAEVYKSLSMPDTSLKSEWSEFNAKIGGLQRGGLYIIAARPGKGKTDFSLQLAVNLSKRYHVRYQTLEMSVEQVTHRILSRVCRINSIKFRDKSLTPEEKEQVNAAGTKMQDLGIIIDDTSSLGCDAIRAKVRQSKPDGIFIDYMGLMSSKDRGKRQGWEITEDTTKALKAMAKELNVAVVALVQLNRQVDRTNGTPTLSDLRGGGSIEADADCVMFMCPEKCETTLSGTDGLNVDVIVEKNRYGSVGKLKFRWQPQYHSYCPAETRYEDE